MAQRISLLLDVSRGRTHRHWLGRSRPKVEILEDRYLPSGGIAEFPIPTLNSGPNGITAGPDGNIWFTEQSGNKIGRITPTGGITGEFSIPTGNSGPISITTGPDGNLWFLEFNGNKIGRMTPAGVVTGEFPVATPDSWLSDIVLGPDGNLWFAEANAPNIGQITPDGVITEFSLPGTPGSDYITVGSDGNLWCTRAHSRAIDQVAPDGTVTEFMPPTVGEQNRGITTGPDGNLWFTENQVNIIGRMTTDGTLTGEFPTPTQNSDPVGITAGPDGNLWFAEYNNAQSKLGRITTGGAITEFPVPTANSDTEILTVGPDSDIWFREYAGNMVGKLYVLSATGTSLTETAGQKFADIVATFHDDQPGMVATNYTALINWGDGSHISTGGVSDNGDGTWDVAASHTYAAAGSYTATVTLTDTHPGGMTTTATTFVQVSGGTGPLLLASGHAGQRSSPSATDVPPLESPVQPNPAPPQHRKHASMKHRGRVSAALLGSHHRLHAIVSPTKAERRLPGLQAAAVLTAPDRSRALAVDLLFGWHHRPHGMPDLLGPLQPEVVDLLAGNLWA
jgi:streptogramin lyase